LLWVLLCRRSRSKSFDECIQSHGRKKMCFSTNVYTTTLKTRHGQYRY
jgi:hypothetical protein